MLNSDLLDKLDALQAKLQVQSIFFEFDYYRKISKKMSDPSNSFKSYWNLLKTPVFHQFFTIIDLSLISKKRAKLFLCETMSINLLIMGVHYRHPFL